MPSASDIANRKVADNDPIQTKIGSLQEIINNHITSLGTMAKNFETIDHKSKGQDDILKRVETKLDSISQDKSKELKLKELEDSVSRLEGQASKIE